jgi:hypothetical protein
VPPTCNDLGVVSRAAPGSVELGAVRLIIFSKA